VGPLAAAARDLALLYEVLAGTSCPLEPDLTGLRLGTVPVDRLGEVEPEILTAVDAAVSELAAAGAAPGTVDVPPFAAWSGPRTTYVLHDFITVHRDRGWYPGSRDRYSEEVASYLAHAGSITADARDAAVIELKRLEGKLRAGLANVDVLALPTTAITAPPVAEAEFRAHGNGRTPIVGTLMRLCGPPAAGRSACSWWAATSRQFCRSPRFSRNSPSTTCGRRPSLSQPPPSGPGPAAAIQNSGPGGGRAHSLPARSGRSTCGLTTEKQRSAGIARLRGEAA
jgi:hypothetical protein